MTTQTSNIDDILVGDKSSIHPQTPENSPEIEYEDSAPVDDNSHFESSNTFEDNEPKNVGEPKLNESQVDDYGNQKQDSKTYTEDEVNERINKAVRDRLSRVKPEPQYQSQAVPETNIRDVSEDNWEQQLEQFVEQTVSKLNSRQTQELRQRQEAEARVEFEQRFIQSMDKFSDFEKVVGNQPVTDAMTLSMRGMKDPAAFIYAASKRNPQELERISKIGDPVVQMVEMGKLEERMRKHASSSSAPRPLGTAKEDSSIPYKKSSEIDLSIEQLIARSDAKKVALLKQRRGR